MKLVIQSHKAHGDAWFNLTLMLDGSLSISTQGSPELTACQKFLRFKKNALFCYSRNGFTQSSHAALRCWYKGLSLLFVLFLILKLATVTSLSCNLSRVLSVHILHVSIESLLLREYFSITVGFKTYIQSNN